MENYHEHEVFRGISLRDTTLRHKEFIECQFENCEFENLQAVDCKFADCTFLKCRVTNPVLDCCSMTGGDFTECRLFGVDWRGLSAGFLAPIEHLKGCELKYNHFVGGNYPKFSFSDNTIRDSLFADCNFHHSEFRRCNLTKTEFYRCDLTGASFEDAEGYAVDISTCQMKGAVFSFPEVVNLLSGLEIVIR